MNVKNMAIVLMYHNIAIPPSGDGLKSLYVTPGMFRFQMWYLKAGGFRVVPLGKIIDLINGKTCPDRLVALTFDDGYLDFYDNAYPVLKRYGYPSTVFLSSDFVGKENVWDCADGLGPRKKLLDWAEIVEMKDNGVVFGSHTKTHPFLTKLSQGEMADEVTGSKKVLEDRLDQSVRFFCYPYGDYNENVVAAVRDAGYLGAVTTKRGLVHVADDAFEMRRSFIRLNTHPLLFILKLHSRYEDLKGR